MAAINERRDYLRKWFACEAKVVKIRQEQEALEIEVQHLCCIPITGLCICLMHASDLINTVAKDICLLGLPGKAPTNFVESLAGIAPVKMLQCPTPPKWEA